MIYDMKRKQIHCPYIDGTNMKSTKRINNALSKKAKEFEEESFYSDEVTELRKNMRFFTQ